MYWQDKYKNPADAVRDLALAAAGKKYLSVTDRHIANVAARSGLSGIGGNFSENLIASGQLSGDYQHLLLAEGQLGSLKSFLKKAVKTAGKLSPSHQLAKALKIDKFSPSQILASKLEQTSKSSPKTPPALAAPVTEVLPNAPAQPIPQLPDIVPTTSPMSFSQGSGGGGGGIPAPVPGEAAQAEETFFTTPVLIGIGLAAALALYLLLRKKR